jgi:ankyrin repeat protein
MNKFALIVITIGTAAALFFLGRYFITHDIWDAVRKNRVSYVEDYVAKGGDANISRTIPGPVIDTQNQTLLMDAAKYGNVEIASILIKHGADLNARSSQNDTPLLYAAQNGSIDIIKLLIDHNADINWDISAHPVTREHGGHGFVMSSANTPIATAIFGGHIDAVKLLLDHGARITDQCINLATHSNRADIIKLLLEHGAIVTPEDIAFAKEIKRDSIADLLMKHLQNNE